MVVTATASHGTCSQETPIAPSCLTMNCHRAPNSKETYEGNPNSKYLLVGSSKEC